MRTGSSAGPPRRAEIKAGWRRRWRDLRVLLLISRVCPELGCPRRGARSEREGEGGQAGSSAPGWVLPAGGPPPRRPGVPAAGGWGASSCHGAVLLQGLEGTPASAQR